MSEQVLGNSQVKVYRAGRVRTVFVTLYSWAITLWYSFKAISVVLFRKQPRLKIDNVIRQWANALVKLTRMRILVKGEFPDTQGQPCIVMCSHSSAYDIPVSFLTIPGSLRMLAKQELFKIPLFGRAMRMSEFLSINRQDKNRAKQDLAIAKSKMEDGIILWVAPEGTRSKDGKLLPLKKGGIHLSIETGATIVPVVIKDIHKVLPTKTFRIQMNQTIEVRIGEAIDAREFGLEQRNELTKILRHTMESMLVEPIKDISHD